MKQRRKKSRSRISFPSRVFSFLFVIHRQHHRWSSAIHQDRHQHHHDHHQKCNFFKTKVGACVFQRSVKYVQQTREKRQKKLAKIAKLKGKGAGLVCVCVQMGRGRGNVTKFVPKTDCTDSLVSVLPVFFATQSVSIVTIIRIVLIIIRVAERVFTFITLMCVCRSSTPFCWLTGWGEGDEVFCFAEARIKM